MPKALYVTTPIYYVNDQPHLGHAYASIHADVMKRYFTLAGYETFFVTGADEHGEKIAKAARLVQEDTQLFVDRHAALFQSAWKNLHVEPSYFVRTTHPEHRQFVQQKLQYLYDKGDIYLSEYEGLYSVGQERFVTEKELVDGKLPEDKDPPQLRKEINYFFRMEKYREWMRSYLQEHPMLIQPAQYRNEILQLLQESIGDLSISRPKERLSWGIPIPWDSQHVTYVWFDALLSYVSPLQERFEKFWPTAHHIIGKDILRTHTLFWLSMCKAMQMEPYQRLYVSGHLLGFDGRKMSKSLGNGIDPLKAAEKYGSDVLRYVLVREISFGSDGMISDEVIEQRLNHDLANDLGNLVARTLAMLHKYHQGRVPAVDVSKREEREKEIFNKMNELPEQVFLLVEEMKISQALERIMEFVRDLNRYINETAPWLLAKNSSTHLRLDMVLNTLHEGLSAISVLLSPVLPQKMEELQKALGIASGFDSWYTPGKSAGSLIAEEVIYLFPKNTQS